MEVASASCVLVTESSTLVVLVVMYCAPVDVLVSEVVDEVK